MPRKDSENLRRRLPGKLKYQLRRLIPVYLMMIPGLAYFLINNYLPMAGIVIAFKRINYSVGIWRSPWVGFNNFRFLFASQTVDIMIRNTVFYNIVFIILGTVFAILIAMMLNEVQSRLAGRVYQTLILLPFLMSMVVVSYLVFAFLSNETGFINNVILPLFGAERKISFYQEQIYWPFILVFVHLWKNIGMSSIIYLASILSIGDEYYEAARIDGASHWQQIKNITIPFLVPTIIMLFILSISRIFYSDFGLFYQVPRNSGVLFPVTQTIDTYVYNALINQNNIALSSAAGFIQSFVGFVLVLSANWLVRKLSKENALF